MAHNLFRHLTDDGLVSDGSNNEMAGAADKYYAGPPAGDIWVIHRAIIHIQDAGNGKISDYGAGVALATGIRLYQTTNGVEGAEFLDLMDGLTVKTNGEWSALCHDLEISNPGAGDTYVSARWTFGRSGQPLILQGSLQDKLVMDVQDSLAGMLTHSCFLQGYVTNTLTGAE